MHIYRSFNLFQLYKKYNNRMYIFHILATPTHWPHACHEAMVLCCNNYAECPKEAQVPAFGHHDVVAGAGVF